MLKHESSDKNNLIVYKASAGSGKTHQLTAEYLMLLYSSPFAYRHILAVTFTNKATEEMKSRIIKELAQLASEKPSDYTDILRKEYGKSEVEIRDQAKDILTSILHDYSAFSISTIDRFFQQTMRAFTREIGLGGGYNIELDTPKVLGEAIDSMLYDLERSDNQQLLDWLIRFSEEKIENGETWNIRNDIRSLSEEIFKESYKAFSDDIQTDIADKELLDDYKRNLLIIIRQYEKKSKEIAEKALNLMLQHQLDVEDFKGTSKSPFKSFVKWANGEIKEPTATFVKLADDITNWCTKTTPQDLKSRIEDCYSDGLNDCVVNIINHYEDTVIYQTAYEINRYFFALGILGDVDKKIRQYASENNIMLISDTTELLHKIIQGSDSPFIYEKVGTRIDHYMIDEFQDTSAMQWTNFLPLVKDSLSAGNKNLIVGDVKQSIYRWRNSDWKLLDEQIDMDFQQNQIEHKSLVDNWRSLKNVIDFNNTIFEAASSLLQQNFNQDLPDTSDKDSPLNYFRKRIERAYSESYQYIPERKKNGESNGHVSIEFIDTEENPNWQTYVLDKLPSVIENLQDNGYSLKDIAILVRTKKEGADAANRLLEYKNQHPDSKYKYDIISDEALYLKNSKSIKLIISLFRYLRNQTDTTLKALAIYEFFKFKEQLSSEGAIRSHFSQNNEFPEEISSELERIRELPLYEMTEEILNLFRDAMEENENIYIQAFMDIIIDFTVKKSSDLDSFLEWWNESGQKQTVFTPDGQDAIRIMTIHKSKGLGFKTVIMPFCNWEIDHRLPTILWCHPQTEPFDHLHLVPVKYSQKLLNTVFAYEYLNEKLHAYIDNLNILYVAFTRAKNNLIIFTPKPRSSQKNINSISSLLWACIGTPIIEKDNKRFINLDEFFEEKNSLFKLGESHNPEKIKKISGKEIKIKALAGIPFDERLRLRLNNKYFFAENGQREYGTLLHEIMSRITSLDNLKEIVESYRISGDITNEERHNITELLRKYLSNPQIAGWYSGEYRILNEVQILQPNGKFIRPDRVMIKDGEVSVVDYKFGEKENKKYNRQVKNYMAQIRKMGYTEVKGYICYVTLDIITEIE